MARKSRKNNDTAVLPYVGSLKAGIYVRLSNEDNGGKGQDSIYNQMEQLQEFVEKAFGTESCSVYVDNGWTGTDFERPEWERMMRDAREGSVNCIVVKDLSRFARNYLEAGEYLEKIFPFLGIRFIAVNDRYDSSGEVFPDKEMTTEFKNLANDYYSKDISKKVLSAFQAKKRQGEFIGNKAPYGYLLKENHFVIDETAAEVVRRIFAMKRQGSSFYEIAKILNEEGIASPSRYAGERGEKKYRNSMNVLWQPQAVSRIVYNRVYTGDLVQGKNNRSIFSAERQGLRNEEDWLVLENSHPAIVERDIFLELQKNRADNRKTWRERQGRAAYENILEGILVCGVCGRPMRRLKDVRNGKAKYYFYCASRYNYLQAECSTSSILDEKIFHAVLRQLSLQIDLAVEMETVLKKMKESGMNTVTVKRKKEEIARQIAWQKEKLARYKYLRMGIYEDMKKGILTKEEYLLAKERYGKLVQELESSLSEAEQDLAVYEQDMNLDNPWMKAFLKFSGEKSCEEKSSRDQSMGNNGLLYLTREAALALLDKVEVFGDKRVHIRFRFRNEYECLKKTMEGMPGME